MKSLNIAALQLLAALLLNVHYILRRKKSPKYCGSSSSVVCAELVSAAKEKQLCGDLQLHPRQQQEPRWYPDTSESAGPLQLFGFLILLTVSSHKWGFVETATIY